MTADLGRVDLGRVGIWSRELRYNPDPGARAAAAAELEDLGYGAIFIPDAGPDAGGDVLGAVAHLLTATRRMPLATGVLNIWMNDPADVAARRASLLARFGPRFLLGLGNSHAPLVESVLGVPYSRPYTKMTAYLDALDAAEPPVPAGERMLAALGPRMLSLARERAGAVHPYLVPPEHTAAAREAVGPGIVLAPEQAVVLGGDRRVTRERARAFVQDYLALPNYVRNLRRLGFTEDDVRGRASDRLVDALVAHGDEDAIAARVRAHHDAGADHVCIYVFGSGSASGSASGSGDEAIPLDAWRRLAAVLTGR
jgi:probable F420-dependent oxidoreductase